MKLPKIKNIFKKFSINTLSQINNAQNYVGSGWRDVFDGSPFPGAMGAACDYQFVDYPTLRARSSQLFRENHYCKGIIRRLLRNEINTGLNPESSPVIDRLGLTEDQGLQWADDRETDWRLWGDQEQVCDYKKLRKIDEIAELCRMTSLLSGDCLVVLRINPKTNLPFIDLIDGTQIQTPTGDRRARDKEIVHGVELNKGRHVAFWINEGNGKFSRIPAWGEKSKRRIAWLVYGTERRLDEVRGEPILASVFYSIGELAKAMNSEQRAFTINAMLPLFIEKTENSKGTKVADQGARRKGSSEVIQPDGTNKTWNWAEWVPGMVPQDLAKGEKPVSFATNRPNANIKNFEEIIINAFAWSLEIPPEIVRLLFQSNFSASRQANNEFDVYLKFRVHKYGGDFYQPIQVELIIQQALTGKIQAQPLLDAWRDPKRYDEFGAWMNTEWTGLSRPSVDYYKDVKAGIEAVSAGFSTAEIQCRKLSNMSWKTVLKKRKREIEETKAAGLSFTSEENVQGEPIGTGAAAGDDGNDNNNKQTQNSMDKQINKMKKTINNLEFIINERIEKLEEVQNVNG